MRQHPRRRRRPRRKCPYDQNVDLYRALLVSAALPGVGCVAVREYGSAFRIVALFFLAGLMSSGVYCYALLATVWMHGMAVTYINVITHNRRVNSGGNA